MALKLKKGDQVQVISGKWKGARGEIMRVLPKAERAIVEGVNIIKKHQKPRSQEDPGGVISKEAPIHVSNLMIIDPESDQPTRFSTKVTEEGGKRVKVRVSSRSGVELP